MLTTGGFELGARWRETREVMGRLDSAEMEVTEYEKNQSFTITHRKGGPRGAARIDTRFTFEPSDAGTKVTVEFELDSPGMPPGFLAPLGWIIAGKVRDVLSHDIADLKATLEKSKH
jgi:carbon monoxide dehydrogenase subunit G